MTCGTKNSCPSGPPLRKGGTILRGPVTLSKSGPITRIWSIYRQCVDSTYVIFSGSFSSSNLISQVCTIQEQRKRRQRSCPARMNTMKWSRKWSTTLLKLFHFVCRTITGHLLTTSYFLLPSDWFAALICQILKNHTCFPRF